MVAPPPLPPHLTPSPLSPQSGNSSATLTSPLTRPHPLCSQSGNSYSASSGMLVSLALQVSGWSDPMLRQCPQAPVQAECDGQLTDSRGSTVFSIFTVPAGMEQQFVYQVCACLCVCVCTRCVCVGGGAPCFNITHIIHPPGTCAHPPQYPPPPPPVIDVHRFL